MSLEICLRFACYFLQAVTAAYLNQFLCVTAFERQSSEPELLAEIRAKHAEGMILLKSDCEEGKILECNNQVLKLFAVDDLISLQQFLAG